MRFGLALAALAAFNVPLLAKDDSADTVAKFLAGLAVPAAPVDTATADNPWIVHSTELDRAWQRADQQLSAIAQWAPDFIGNAYQDNNTVFYMFSGPDILYAHALFPNARTYILCGNEPVGAVPDLSKIPPEILPVALANVRKSLESVLNWSFFITKNMKTDLTQPQLSGTLPLLYVFLARARCTINSVTPVAIDRNGNLAEGSKGETPGVRIAFTGPSGLSQTLYYFCTDLSDDGVKSKPGLLKFCEAQGPGTSLLKAASYLMHGASFSRIRDFLLARSQLIVQDDSGIPLRFFDGQKWTIRFCGQYLGPIETFKQYYQPDLADAYAHTAAPAPLPFGFGYQWQPNRSAVMILRIIEVRS